MNDSASISPPERKIPRGMVEQPDDECVIEGRSGPVWISPNEIECFHCLIVIGVTRSGSKAMQ